MNRFQPWEDFAEEHAGKLLFDRSINYGTLNIQQWQFPRGQVVVLKYHGNGKDQPCTGWDVFIPASTSTKVDTTLAEVQLYLEAA